MNVDAPAGQPNTAQYSAVASANTPHDYFSYATTTAQMIDRWAFNHANILSNLSQLPPDLLPSLIPQISQQLQQQQQQLQKNPLMTTPGMSALAVAAAAAAAATAGSQVGLSQQQQQQHHHHHQPQPMQVDHTFAVPAVPIHRQQASSLQPGAMPTQYEYSGAMASMQQQQQQQQHSMINAQFPGMQPQHVVQPQGGFSHNVQYAASSLQPLMVPPPSPTVLSYYTADPTYWISLLGQHAYQPQAYHYDYQQQQQISSLGLLLLTQQYAPPPPLASQTQPHIDQAIHQSNIVAAQMVAAAAAAAAASQYAPGAHTLQPAIMPSSAGVSMQYGSQSGAVNGYAGFPSQQQQQQPQQTDAFGQPARRSSSFTNLALLQNQQQQQLHQSQAAAAFLRPDLGTQYQQPQSASSTTYQQAQPMFGSSSSNGVMHPSSAGVNGRFSHHQQQQQVLGASRSHGLLSAAGGSSSGLGQHAAYSHQGFQQPQEPLKLFGAGIKPSADLIPGTQITRQQALRESVRDHVLQTAHQLYSANARNPALIDMLQSLHQLHPRHLPTLLLLACTYFSSGQAEKSLEYNNKILEIDPKYVEAMSNIGTTLRSMGYAAEAEAQWWSAIRLSPGYWDAVENLLGVLCGSGAGAGAKAGEAAAKAAAATASSPPRYAEALQLCEFVDERLCQSRTPLRYAVQAKQLPRLQSLLYSAGNLRLALGDVAGARREYEKAAEVALGGQLRLEDAVVRIAQAGLDQAQAQAQAQQPLAFASLPLTLLAPDAAARVLHVLFPATRGVLPGFAGLAAAQLQQANHVAANLLLALAKLHQDHAAVAQPLSVVLPLYYLALALAPSPSTCNNLGIILSAIPSPPTPTLVPSVQGGHQAAQAPMGAALALQYYTHGLRLDARHPHLYTNLGSLLKDLGYVHEAVQMYRKAIELSPAFDVALANLGNAVKDMGCVQDSVEYYLRAARASPDFVEAVCGLANAMAGVCDWRARDGLWTAVATRWQAVLRADAVAADIFAVASRGRRPTAPAVAAKMRRLLGPAPEPAAGAADMRRGWMDRIVEIVDQQLADGRAWGRGLLLARDASAAGGVARPTRALLWFLDGVGRLLPERAGSPLAAFVHAALDLARAVAAGAEGDALPAATLRRWAAVVRQMRCEGAWALRLSERVVVAQQRRLFRLMHVQQPHVPVDAGAPEFRRPQLPTGLAAPGVPTVLPFHTFTYPLDAREVRLISHRNAMRLSFATLGGGAPWLAPHVTPPPPPPAPLLHIGYVSSDFNNHPLAHLMQSVFGMHDRRRFRVFCYATTAADGSAHRAKIEAEADVFVACAGWSTQRIVERVAADAIHVLVNLNGYTKGARNEVFAARPAPVLVAFMGFAGTLGAGWCDYVVADPIVCPPWTVRAEVRAERRRRARVPEMAERPHVTAPAAAADEPRRRAWAAALAGDFGELDPEEAGDGDGVSGGADGVSGGADGVCGGGHWVYTERMIYMPHTYFVNDHRQGFREDDELRAAAQQTPAALWRAEQDARYRMRRELFPQLADSVFIFANFNQLYKIDPLLFRLWLRILERSPNSVIWLLRFPAAGEKHLLRVAAEWAGAEVASRVIFTDVAPKHMHIKRGRIADAFLDTTECNAHTTAVDILWSGTPVLTWARHEHKLCSRVAASVVCATGCGRQMVVGGADEYVDRAVAWVEGATHSYEYTRPLAAGAGGAGGAGSGEILEPDPQTGLIKHRLCGGPAMDIRRTLFMSRDCSRLFDTQRWTRNLEKGLAEAWRRWVAGEDEDEVGVLDDCAAAAAATAAVEKDAEGRPAAATAASVAVSEEQLRERKREWCRRIGREMDEAIDAFAASAASSSSSSDNASDNTSEKRRPDVFAPRGRSIWVLDDDDVMPAQSWMGQMVDW
ncbi:hypothetical protein LPJ53_001147 [Coemansia erecta]|uniref:protein O-GlcNAc transferase n=1 Tax=Coemansia erecta TaxID=147472 RepID=A0A9W7Y430_9FUNG|nr:hypothetical protein LPJ53_001147 [Coemansia erecta]